MAATHKISGPMRCGRKPRPRTLPIPITSDLKTLRAKLRMEDQSTVTLDALDGRMDNKNQLLDLHHNIFLQTSSGYEARLSQALSTWARTQ